MDYDQALFLDNHGDDIYGLWEVNGYFSLHYPGMSSTEKLYFLEILIEAGFISVYWTDDAKFEGAPLPSEHALKFIRDISNWEPPTKNFEGSSVYLKESQIGGMQREKQFKNI